MSKFPYPSASEIDAIDTYHGVEIKDPYRWMENPGDGEVKKFVECQNSITMPYLNSFASRAELSTDLRNLWNYPKYSCPYRHGDNYFFYKNSGLDNQSILYVQNTLTSKPEVLLDPNSFNKEGTSAVATSAFSKDGKIFAFGISESGSDWMTVFFRDVKTKTDFPDVLRKVKFSGLRWTPDNAGIFYGRYTDEYIKGCGTETGKNSNQKLYYHHLNTSQDEDVCVVEFPEHPDYRIGCSVSECGKWLIVSPIVGCKNNLLYVGYLGDVDKISGTIPLTPIVEKFEADYEYITSIGDCGLFLTNKDAPNYRLISINFREPAESNWKTLIEKHSTDVLSSVTPIHNDKLIVVYMKDVKDSISLHSMKTGEKLYDFPINMGTISDVSGLKEHDQFFFYFSSFVTPGLIFEVDVASGDYTPKVFREICLPNYSAANFEEKQVFYISKDGTRIPMFLITKKGMKKDPNTPCHLYGYGGFNISMQPGFSLLRLVFVQNFSGIAAIPNIRGGGEYGEAWHNAGRFLNKQNSFDDFQYAAKFLVDNGYTSSNKLVIHGASNGGLLVAACANQAPNLFGAVVANVGVFDMLRFHKFTIGYAWTSDYGCSDDEEHFRNLLSYSPLHNVESKEGCQYPATFLLTADHDDRVVPSHSLKYIATLQKKIGSRPEQDNPLIIRVYTNTGHGSGKPTQKMIEEAVDILSFIAHSLGLEYHH